MWINTVENLNAILEKERKQIICFGCGNYFERFIEEYPQYLECIYMILDNKVEEGTRKVIIRGNYEIIVGNPCEAENMDMAKYIVIFCAVDRDAMKKQLDERLGYKYESFYYPLFEDYNIYSLKYKMKRMVEPIIYELDKYHNIDNVLDSLKIWDKETLRHKLLNEEIVSIPRFTVIVTPKCSLRCKECENIMWALRDVRDLEKEKIKKSIEVLCNAVDFIPCIDIIGGEPFVAKCFDEILEFCLQQEKIKKIEIVTNGTVVPIGKRKSLLKHAKVKVLVSKYPGIVDNTPLVSCLEKEKIEYELLDSEWYQTGRLDKRKRSEEDIRRQYYNCYSSLYCKGLLEDKMYVCPRAAGMGMLGMVDENDVLKIDNEDTLRERLIKYQLIPKYSVCDYCDGGMEYKKMVPVAEQE